MNTIRAYKVCIYNSADLSTNWDVFGKSFFTIFEALLVCKSRPVFRTFFIIVDAYHKTTEICDSLFLPKWYLEYK